MIQPKWNSWLPFAEQIGDLFICRFFSSCVAHQHFISYNIFSTWQRVEVLSRPSSIKKAAGHQWIWNLNDTTCQGYWQEGHQNWILLKEKGRGGIFQCFNIINIMMKNWLSWFLSYKVCDWTNLILKDVSSNEELASYWTIPMIVLVIRQYINYSLELQKQAAL